MSKITQEKYDLVKIERLKHYLESAEEKGKPKFYEIFVDNLKAVEKTSDPFQFDEYLVYMGEDTRMVKVLIYTSTENCPRNDKFLFTVAFQEKDEKSKQELSGIEIEEKIHSVVQQEREKMNTELLKKELGQVRGQLEEAEGYIEELEKTLEQTRTSKTTAKENLGEVFSLALENIIRRNTHLLGGIPLVGQGLAGIVDQDNKRLEEVSKDSPGDIEERNVSFQKHSEANQTRGNTSKEDQQAIDYFNALRQAFTDEELVQVMDIIGVLSTDKESILSILELLQEEDNEHGDDQPIKDSTAKLDVEDFEEPSNQL